MAQTTEGQGQGSPFLSMLADLATDPGLMDQFRTDRDSVMDKYGLTNEQKSAMRSALDQQRVHDLFDELGREVFRLKISC